MKKFLILIAVAITTQIANAQENILKEQSVTENKYDNTRTSIYLHPVSLIAGAGSKSLFLYSTIEVPSNLSRSFIIRPSIWYISGEFDEIDFYLEDPIRIGTDFGMRFYPGEKGAGLYLQAQAGLFLLSAKESVYDYDNWSFKTQRANAFWFDVMGYIGYSKKYSETIIFIDVGIGLLINNGISPLADVNLGIGFPLGKKEK